MSYILQSRKEARRLDEQSSQKEFSLDQELKEVTLKPGDRVLDAGCGSGVLCRYLEEHYRGLSINGCDQSRESLEYAKAHGQPSSNFFIHDFVNDPLPAKFDHIFNRLVAHHLSEENLHKAFTTFYQGLAPQGRLTVIDVDGLFMNLGTSSRTLLEKMNHLHRSFPGNLHVGRVIPGILSAVGFKEVSWSITVMDFQHHSRQEEARQWKERFESALSFYVSVFKTEFEARRFFKEYLAEVSNEDVPLFYNKFIITAQKT